MKSFQNHVRAFLPVLFLLFLASAQVGHTQNSPARASVHAIRGSASCFVDGIWQPLKENTQLMAGAVIKTGKDATVDLLLMQSGTVLRLTPESELRFDRLDEMPAGEMAVTSTRLTLLSGAVIGSQRKLAAPSEFEIKLANGVAKIVGTEYLVRADGAVTCLSGEVSVICNRPGNGGSVNVSVEAGFSFDPPTGKVVRTTAHYLNNITADVNSVREYGRTFKIGRGATVVCDHDDDKMSPNHGHHGNGHDHDDDGHGGHDNGHGNDGHGNDGHR